MQNPPRAEKLVSISTCRLDTMAGLSASLILDRMKELTSPLTAEKGNEDGNLSNNLDDILQLNLETFLRKISSTKEFSQLYAAWNNTEELYCQNSDSVRWRFVCSCLKLLSFLNNSLMEFLDQTASVQSNQSVSDKSQKSKSSIPPLSPGSLSISQQKIVLATVQFIVCLGICPNVEPGVGIPVSRRSQFFSIISDSNCNGNVSDIEKKYRLLVCAKILMTCIKTPSLGALILSRHISDLLAILLQLCYGCTQTVKDLANSVTSGAGSGVQGTISGDITPSSYVDMVKDQGKNEDASLGTSSMKNENSDHGTVTDHADSAGSRSSISGGTASQFMGRTYQEKEKSDTVHIPTGLAQEDNEFCEDSLKTVLNQVYQPLLVRELLVLQGGVAARPTDLNHWKLFFQGSGVGGSPLWLRKVCGILLSDILMKPRGIHHIVQGMLGGVPDRASVNPQSADWRKCDVVAKVIACSPHRTGSVEQYYKHIAPQVLELLQCRDRKVTQHYLRVACTTISNMASKYPVFTKQYVLQPLLMPLMQCTESEDHYEGEHQIVVGESSLEKCIEDIHRICVAGPTPHVSVLTCISPLLPTLFELYCATKPGVSILKTTSFEILVSVFQQSEQPWSLACLSYLAFNESSQCEDIAVLPMSRSLTFQPGPTGGTVVVTKSCDSDVPGLMQLDIRIPAMVDLLKSLQKDGLTGEFFLLMLKELTDIINEEAAKQRSEVVSLCMEGYMVTLQRAVQVCEQTEDDMLGAFETETLTMAMGLLTALLGGALQIDTADRDQMNTLLPLLQTITSRHPDAHVQEMASDLRIAIATRGIVWSELLKKSSADSFTNTKEVKIKQERKELNTKSKPMIEVLSDAPENSSKENIHQKSHTKTVIDHPSDENVCCPQNEPPIVALSGVVISDNRNVSDSELPRQKDTEDIHVCDTDLQTAFTELCDPLIPVRGHALLTLEKMARSKKSSVLRKQDKIIKIFEENLNHHDSYLYLPSANGLAAMADIFPDMVLPQLAGKFANFDSELDGGNRGPELRMKIGESLMKAIRNMGDVVVKYRDILLSAILNGAKDQNELVRASSLSNLGELCRLLRFSLGGVLHEVINCCSSLLKSDKSSEVRKAAAMTVTLLLQGLGKDALTDESTARLISH
ncbi:hypothetical protein ScPMuIL_001819 [Solemya velum]